MAAARRLGVEVTVACDRRQALSGPLGDRALTVPLGDPEAAAERVSRLAERTPLDAVVAADDAGVLTAAHAAARLGLRGNLPEAAARTRDKAAMRTALAAAGVEQPAFRVVGPRDEVLAAARAVGLPCVVKPISLSASRGVIRADDAPAAERAAARVRAILGEARRDPHAEPLLVERYVAGREVAVEGLLCGGRLEVLAVFDKPDPLEGPYFEETILVQPARLAEGERRAVEATAAGAARALGLREGPVHAELRVTAEGRASVLELAARTIGGLCARTLRFGLGASLEELVLRHALGMPLDGLVRHQAASGVMMLPIPAAGVLCEVRGRERALEVPGVAGLEVTVPLGRRVQPLPEGDRYLGFVFASGGDADDVEAALRAAHAALEIQIAPAAEAPVTGPRPEGEVVVAG